MVSLLKKASLDKSDEKRNIHRRFEAEFPSTVPGDEKFEHNVTAIFP